MSQVSRKILPKDTQEKIFKIFFKSLARLHNPSEIQKLLFDLLGPVEQIMLAKRLAIALLLSRGYSYESIKGLLRVSQETIARVNISLNYGGEGYKMVINKIFRSERLEQIFENIEDVTIATFPASSVKKTWVRNRNKNRKIKTALG